MKTAGIVLTIFLALGALGIGFVGTTAALYFTQPSSKVNTTVSFVVNTGDSTTTVCDHLQADGLIRNALACKLYVKFKHLPSFQAGTYQLSPTMTMSQIAANLQNGKAPQILAGLPDNERATQYPPYFASLPNFNATAFMLTAKTGIEPDGTTKLWQKYWFVEQPQKNVYDALEGYLYPDHYEFLTTADTTTVIETMVEQLGAQFCPGPASNFTQYIDTLADCKQHAATVGTKKVNIFAAMEAAYHTKDDTLAIYDTLIMASMTSHEAAGPAQAPGVVGVLWTRYEALKGYITNAGQVSDLGTDASAEYARDNQTPPKNGKYWTPLTTAGKDVATTNPYNNYSDVSILPPGPIANPSNLFILAAAAPVLSKYWFYVHDHCGNIHYAVDAAHAAIIDTKYINTKVCSTSLTS